MTLEDLSFEVCTTLNAAGARVVLTGGSAAAYYAPLAYQSHDADFVIVFGNSGEAAKALERIGFSEKNGIYRRPGTQYTLEFPAGPLAIGSEYVTDYATLRRGDQILYILHPDDSVRDRLLWYYAYDDFSALRAAIGVARAHTLHLSNIRAWSEREGFLEKFEFFNRQIAAAR